ncbi:MAG: hypothetical protein LBS15_02920 [Endomicrobium sp.]|jgi:hypothetical protein|nr:hypothetical protein [Endomicrobium sp.]
MMRKFSIVLLICSLALNFFACQNVRKTYGLFYEFKFASHQEEDKVLKERSDDLAEAKRRENKFKMEYAKKVFFYKKFSGLEEIKPVGANNSEKLILTKSKEDEEVSNIVRRFKHSNQWVRLSDIEKLMEEAVSHDFQSLMPPLKVYFFYKPLSSDALRYAKTCHKNLLATKKYFFRAVLVSSGHDLYWCDAFDLNNSALIDKVKDIEYKSVSSCDDKISEDEIEIYQEYGLTKDDMARLEKMKLELFQKYRDHYLIFDTFNT